jgi:hypothetical protein
VNDNKVCGYIFAILEGEPCAYILPIEPVFAEISSYMSGSRLSVDVPDAATVETLKRTPPARQANETVDESKLTGAAASILGYILPGIR